jgi:hypothetical protein
VEPYRRVPARPHNGTRQRALLFLFLFLLPFAIRAALPLLTRPNDIVIFLGYEEEKHVPRRDDALLKQWRHQQRSVALALAALLF